MTQATVIRRLVLEALSAGAPAHEVAAQVIRDAGQRPSPNVQRALLRLRGGDLHGGLATLGCEPAEIAAVVADPQAARRISEHLARLPSRLTFVQELSSTTAYGVVLLLVSSYVGAVGARMARSMPGFASMGDGSDAVVAFLAFLGLLGVTWWLQRAPLRTHALLRTATIAAAAGPAHVASVDRAAGSVLRVATGALDGLGTDTLASLSESLVVRWQRETALATEAIRVLSLVLGGLPAIWIVVRLYAAVSGVAGTELGGTP